MSEKKTIELQPKRKSMPLDEFIEEHQDTWGRLLVLGKGAAILWMPGQDEEYDSFCIVALDENGDVPNCTVNCDEDTPKEEMDEMMDDFYPPFLEWEDLEIRRKI